MTLLSKWKIDKGFFKDIVTLLAGTGGSQILSVLLIPVITRLFSVENFGVMTTFSIFSVTIAVFSCGGYEQAINLPKNDEKAWSLFCLCIYFAVALCLLLYILIFFFELQITRWIFKCEKENLVYLLPLTVLGNGIYTAMIFLMVRFRKFSNLSFASFAGVVGNQGTKLTGGFLVGDKLSPLILGTLFYNVLPSFFLCFKIYQNIPRRLFCFPRKLDLLSVLHEYRKFPLYATWVELLINLGRSMIIFLLAAVYDRRVVGYYGLAYTALAMPISLFVGTIRQACLPRITTLMHERKSISSFLLKIVFGLSAGSILPFVIVLAFGPDLFSLIFGSNWREAGVYARILVPWCFTMLLMPPASIVLTITQNQAFRLGFYLILTGFQVVVFLLLKYLKMDIYTILAMLSIGSTVLYIGKIYYGYRIALNYRNT